MLPASLSPRLLTGMLVWGTLQGTPENSVQALWAPRVGAGGSQPGRPRPPVPGSAPPGHRATLRFGRLPFAPVWRASRGNGAARGPCLSSVHV